MVPFRTKGTELFDGSGNRIAMVRGTTIYDACDNKVATLSHPDVYDSRGNRVATLRGSEIYDGSNRKIATISDLYKEIDSLLCGPALVGLWLFFVRQHSLENQNLKTAQRSPIALWSLLRQMLRFRGPKQMKS
jgi:hypothetical protein